MARSPKRSEDRPLNIATDWLHGLDGDDKEGFIQVWRNSKYLLDRLKEIINRELATLYLDLKTDYEKTNWQFIRADKNGRIASLERILTLLP
jgi:hypothetical protein